MYFSRAINVKLSEFCIAMRHSETLYVPQFSEKSNTSCQNISDALSLSYQQNKDKGPRRDQASTDVTKAKQKTVLFSPFEMLSHLDNYANTTLISVENVMSSNVLYYYLQYSYIQYKLYSPIHFHFHFTAETYTIK